MADLERVSGLDTALGLRNCGGNVKLYRRALKVFAQTYCKGFTSPRIHADLKKVAHSVAGACSAVGATPMANLAYTVSKTPDASDASQCATSLDEGLRHLCADIERHAAHW